MDAVHRLPAVRPVLRALPLRHLHLWNCEGGTPTPGNANTNILTSRRRSLNI